MSVITEGSVVTICFEIKTTKGNIQNATGTVYWIDKGNLAVLMPDGLIWHGKLNQIFPAQSVI